MPKLSPAPTSTRACAERVSSRKPTRRCAGSAVEHWSWTPPPPVSPASRTAFEGSAPYICGASESLLLPPRPPGTMPAAPAPKGERAPHERRGCAGLVPWHRGGSGLEVPDERGNREACVFEAVQSTIPRPNTALGPLVPFSLSRGTLRTRAYLEATKFVIAAAAAAHTACLGDHETVRDSLQEFYKVS